jgi:hypothetical protein
VLKWFPANIGVHHVHNLAGRIPYYRLPEDYGDRLGVTFRPSFLGTNSRHPMV